MVVGKFYPHHRGHKHLIETAESQCEEVVVILCARKSETIPASTRAGWIQKIHPKVRIVIIDDNKLDDDDSKAWAKFTIDLLGYTPDAVFTSESYGEPYAAFMGAEHVLVDIDRKKFPISGTMVRENPARHLQFLEPPVRAYFAKRIVIIGAESTGKTTLAQALAKHYGTVWVPEYGRFYTEGRIHSDKHQKWRTEEFVVIARAQNCMEDALAEHSHRLVICDTDAFATGVWHERYVGSRSPKVEKIAQDNHHDLYIVTGDEIPFVQDEIREGEHTRHVMHEKFIERLREDKKPYIVVRGTPEERLAIAVREIDRLYPPSGITGIIAS